MNAILNPLELGQYYSKKDLAEHLQEETISVVREGLYYCKKTFTTLLFVDLVKRDKEEKFHFNDFFEGEYFHWDSQTTQHIDSPKIQEMISGERTPHLFVRMHQKIKNVTQPFIYCGALEYLEFVHGTSKPVHIVFRSLDIDEETGNEDLLEIYTWKPNSIGEAPKKSSKEGRISAERKKKYKKPDLTERKGLVTSRVGQGYYRQQIIDKWNATCPLTGCKNLKILIASHIVPWKECNEEERLDEENGILLSPNADALFDKHLISFDDDGSMLVSSSISTAELQQLGVNKDDIIPVSKRMRKYLARHRMHLK